MWGTLTIGWLKQRRSETLGEELQNTQQQLEGYHKVILHLQKCSCTGQKNKKWVTMWPWGYSIHDAYNPENSTHKSWYCMEWNNGMRQIFFLNDSPLAKRNMVQLLSQSSVLLEGNMHRTVRSLVFNGTTLESSFGNYRWANNRMKQDFYSLCFVRLCRNLFTSPGGK